MATIFLPGSYGKFVDHEGADDSHFGFGKYLIIINGSTEVGVDPVEEKLFFVNGPVGIIVCEGGINFCEFRIILAGAIEWNERFPKICMPAWAKNLHLWDNCAPDLFA